MHALPTYSATLDVACNLPMCCALEWQGSIEEAAKLRDQVRGYAGRMEAMQWELKAAEDAKHDRDVRLEAMTQTADEHKRALEEESGKLVQERAKRQRCEDDTQVICLNLLIFSVSGG